MKYIILLLTVLFSLQSYAADDGDWWLQRQIQLQQNREDYARRVYGSARHTYDTVDPLTSKTKTVTKIAIVEDVPSKQKLGKVLLERAKKYKSGIAGVVGGAAVSALIESIGWVMEDGTYVKYKQQTNDLTKPSPFCSNTYRVTTGTPSVTSYGCTIQEVSTNYCTIHSTFSNSDYCKVSNITSTTFRLQTSCKVWNGTCYGIDSTITPQYITNPYYDSTKTPGPQKIIITDQQVGAIASGDYQDPVDSNYNITDKQYRPVVADAYKHDPSGTGNDLANVMNDRLKNAPPTSDGKPAPIGDSRYSTSPQEDKTTNDRTWNDDGSTATGETTPTTDPSTGQPTGGQSISLQFPIFCEWAHSMCKWYDDWKASDTVYKDHMTKTEEHQTQEKGFWQKVSDWFDWTKEPLDEEPDLQEEEPDTQGIFERTFNTTFSLSNECPPDIPFTLETYFLSGSWNISTRWLCIIFTFLGYPLVFLSHCCGLWILYETVVHRQIKW